MKKKYQIKCVKFMRAKKTRLRKSGIYNNYFDKLDEKNIMSWTDKDAKKIWRKLCKLKNKLSCLSTNECVFCLKHEYVKIHFFGYKETRQVCKKCFYGKNHGICNKYKTKNIYATIVNSLDNKYIYYYRIFSNDFYINLIEKLDGE